MPTYVYKREDGTTFEIEQRISADALSTCPTTGQKVTRLISGGTGLIFKGSGFYLTDYARKDKDGKNSSKESKIKSVPASEKNDSTTSSSKSSASDSSDSKPSGSSSTE